MLTVAKEIRLETEVLDSGITIVRPEGSFGTCGYHTLHKVWHAGIVGKDDTAKSAFLRANSNWASAKIVRSIY